MRYIFMDEAGISDAEPIVVVSGVVVDADSQIIPLEERLGKLIDKHVPPSDREGFVFHAKQIWAGTGYYKKNADFWTAERRFALLDDLASLPSQMELPILYGQAVKEQIKAKHLQASSWGLRDLAINTHAIAFLHCTLNVEEYMRLVWAGEISQLVAEDNSEARAAIKGCYALLRNPNEDLYKSELLPLKKVKGPVLFADKRESAPLQLADVSAFLIRRRLTKDDERIRRFYSKLLPMMLLVPRADREAPDMENLKTLYPFGPLTLT